VQVIEDVAEVLRLHQERIRKIAMRQETDEELRDRLLREERVVLIMAPERFFPTEIRA
jgi:hypothetical protein